MYFSVKFLAVAIALSCIVNAECRNSSPGSPTFGGASCRQGIGFDHTCDDKSAFFKCCSNSNCT
ncbi:uncharacterized protein CTRU02_209164 [Colletotrichum truncatum]|uniref:Uncharacterized protein n=1 Tax=Colletotrichum truncatum TaxID=5467 RepID=A0ACC3YYA9_COLTU|nr:uncharacterized protein CTRU02_14529 [Colletotrichum truncatum]KAF6782085.1 hypothetical protein CTRU02_14529 [Colletotrichum truncatum]